jgi:pimeloyl-ACP methyl ester carboxylesterase
MSQTERTTPTTPTPTSANDGDAGRRSVLRRLLGSLVLGSVTGIVGLVGASAAIVAMCSFVPIPFFVSVGIAIVGMTFGTIFAIRAMGRRGWCGPILPMLLALGMVLIPTAVPFAALAIDSPTGSALTRTNTAHRGRAELVHLGTGSTVAVWSLPAPTTRSAAPVVFLHGGPGMYTTSARLAQGEVFRAAGFNTVFFDQAGSGASAKLSVGAYSVDRSVADLEALRVHLKVERMVLWGSSWGSALAALYADRYPEHVAGLVLVSPGAFPGTEAERDYAPTNQTDDLAFALRVDAHRLLIEAAPRMAERLATQEQAGVWMDHQLLPVAGRFACRGDAMETAAAAEELIGGANPFVNQSVLSDLVNTPLKTERVGVPSIVVRGGCDFHPLSNAERYADFAQAEVVTVPNVGHGAAVLDGAHRQLEPVLTAILAATKQ